MRNSASKKAAIVDSTQFRWSSGAVNGYAIVMVNQFLTYRENNRPQVDRPISHITLSQVGSDSVLDINAVLSFFEDLDQDTLTYSTLSSNDQIATASISRNLLKVRLGSFNFAGRCQIKISADDGRVDDGRGNTEETSFEINRPPFLLRPISDQAFALGDSSRRFIANLRELFLDPDGDVLAHSLINSDNTVALVDTIGNAIVAMPGDSIGEATITVFANDRRGGTLSTSFKITNAGQTTPPRLAGSGISDQVLIIAGQPFIQTLYDLFTDVNGDSLNFEGRSSDRRVALAVVESDTLTIVPLAVGGAQITVTANDGKGGEVSTTFHVQVARSQAPLISHNPTSDALQQKTAFGVTATIIDDEGKLDEAILRYRVAGRTSYEEKRLRIPSVDDTTLQVTETIPSEAVLSQGVEYFITARDNRSVDARWPEGRGVFSVRVRVEGEGISNPRPQPSGGEQTSYHLFSVPFDLDNKSARAVLEDDLGTFDVRQWRFLELVMNTTTDAVSYLEFPNTAALAPGKAFWLIIRKSGRYIDTGPGTSVLSSKPLAITLQQGWNLVGNPFNFPAYTADTLSNGDALRCFAYEAGAWSDTLAATSRPWQPFEGYVVYANATCSLFVDPDPSRSGTALAKLEAATDSDALWSVRVLAQCQEAIDEDNTAAIVVGANQAWDEIDQPEPPLIGEYVSVYFPHLDWKTLAKTYCLDARPELTQGEIWEFEVKTNIRDKVNLSFEGIESVPPEFEVYLTDDALRITHNLREKNAYAIAGTQHPKSLKLVVGTNDFINQKLADVQLIPTQYELSQNFPNPFNPATTIRYGLPQARKVTLKIYNLLGAEVATLVNDEEKKAGYHTAIWNGRDQAGKLASSGVYIYRLQAGSFTMAKKTALVK